VATEIKSAKRDNFVFIFYVFKAAKIQFFPFLFYQEIFFFGYWTFCFYAGFANERLSLTPPHFFAIFFIVLSPVDASTVFDYSTFFRKE